MGKKKKNLIEIYKGNMLHMMTDEVMDGCIGPDAILYGYENKKANFPTKTLVAFDGFDTQFIGALQGVKMTNRNGQYYWGKHAWDKDHADPIYVAIHDATTYIGTSKKAIKKAIREECKTCQVKSYKAL